MKKIKIAQQVLNPSGVGGVSSEYRSLISSSLNNTYDFIQLVLMNPHRGLNFHDILFYYQQLKKHHPEIIHVRGAAVDGLNAIIAAKLIPGIKVLTTVHGMWSDSVFISPIKKWFYKNIIERTIFSLSDGISCVCNNSMERSCFFRYKRKMLPVVYNRMPIFNNIIRQENKDNIRKKYNIPNDAIVALFLGRLSKEKGLDILYDAILKAKEKLPSNFVLLIVGDGSYTESCLKLFKMIQCNVIFAGKQSNVEQFYHASDFFILPSLHENHSISLLEACAARLPSIVSNCGGNPETIEDGKTGLIIPVDDSESLATAILRMTDELFLSELRRNIERYDFSKFSSEACDDSLNLVYTSLLGHHQNMNK